ncbi:protein STRUBBELIG-RECEPTOR FAMILY 5-like isoform X3 [Punica granatum]|nr:protein STRUBBELIG-RECEPTOR FAMILY 5-like isoform X3 [Punica granatum]
MREDLFPACKRIMNHRHHHSFVGFFLPVVTICVGILSTIVHSKTNSLDVSVLNVMYTNLNSPSELSGWKSSGGDPCGDSWKGIECSGSSITEIKLSDLGLSGSMGYQLSNLKSVTHFDLSKNNLNGNIPYQLPPNAAHIDLSHNSFSGNVPYSISQMTDLKDLYLGHNQLNGQLSDMFGKLSKFATLDLSYNKLSGNLPQSFANLSSLNKMYLQNNQFSGSIDVLAGLPLSDLNVENNRFTGWIPEDLKNIENIETGGNSWSSGPAPPPPPGAARINHRSKEGQDGGGKSSVNGLAIAGIIMGVLVVLALLMAVFSRRSSASSVPSHFLDEERASQRRAFTPLTSQELSDDLRADICKNFKDHKSRDSSASLDAKALQKSPSIGFRAPLYDGMSSLKDDEFANQLNARRSTSFLAVSYSLADLQTCTCNFATGRLIGKGSIGRVYRAKYADGKVIAVKKIDSSLFQGRKPEEFSEIIQKISSLHHPNIVELLGYCSEQGHNMLIYDYFRNGSLHEFLHMSDDYSKPLTWNTRVRIALGTARAVEYLHEVFSPSIVHKSIKSSNILLDMELNPRLSDCGLATFHQLTSQNLGAGYNAPECSSPSAYTLKSDVYSFGVVMLELLTGRMPLDSFSKPRSEQCLVRWAMPQLIDIDALEKMVDPALRGLYPPTSVSRFADIIALCLQAEPEFRPPMSEVVQALVRLVQRSSINKRGESPGASSRLDDYDY